MTGGLRAAADLMSVSARTAPKSAGQDFVVTEVIEGDALKTLARAMLAFGERTGKANFDRDAANVWDSEALLLVGIKDGRSPGLNCGACGAQRCVEINTHEGEFRGPQCAFRLLDMGIAIGSAVRTASILTIDNRIMYSAGVVAREIGLIDADFVMGIPMSVTGKNLYFSRRAKFHETAMGRALGVSE